MLTARIRAFLADEDGATAIEYGLIAMLICVAILGAVVVLGDGIKGLYNNGSAETLTTQASRIK